MHSLSERTSRAKWRRRSYFTDLNEAGIWWSLGRGMDVADFETIKEVGNQLIYRDLDGEKIRFRTGLRR